MNKEVLLLTIFVSTRYSILMTSGFVNTCINFLLISYAVQGNENSHKKVSLMGAALHPFLA